jgi:hypothetical protein
MSYTFEVTRVTLLPSSKSAVLDGRLVEGRVLTGTAANLISKATGASHQVIVKGPVVGPLRQTYPGEISLVLDMRQEGVCEATAGDTLVSIDQH